MTEHLMREIRGIVGDRGLFLIYENAGPDGEDRGARLLRWERQNRPLWTALKPEEYEAMAAQRPRQRFSRDDLPRWHSLGYEAGFGKVRELFLSPTNLFPHVLF